MVKKYFWDPNDRRWDYPNSFTYDITVVNKPMPKIGELVILAGDGLEFRARVDFIEEHGFTVTIVDPTNGIAWRS